MPPSPSLATRRDARLNHTAHCRQTLPLFSLMSLVPFRCKPFSLACGRRDVGLQQVLREPPTSTALTPRRSTPASCKRPPRPAPVAHLPSRRQRKPPTTWLPKAAFQRGCQDPRAGAAGHPHGPGAWRGSGAWLHHAGIPGCSGRGQSAQEVIGAGANAVVQQQPRRLQVLNQGGCAGGGNRAPRALVRVAAGRRRHCRRACQGRSGLVGPAAGPSLLPKRRCPGLLAARRCQEAPPRRHSKCVF